MKNKTTRTTAKNVPSSGELLGAVNELRNELGNYKRLEENTGDEHYALMADAVALELKERMRELQGLQRT